MARGREEYGGIRGGRGRRERERGVRRGGGEGGQGREEEKEIRVDVLDPSVHDYLQRSRRSPRPASFSPLFPAFTREDQQDSFAGTPRSVASPPRGFLSRVTRLEENKKKKKKKESTVLSNFSPNSSTQRREFERTDSPAAAPTLVISSHVPRLLSNLSSRNLVDEDPVSRRVTLLPSPSELASATRPPSNHLPWEEEASLHPRATASYELPRAPRFPVVFRREARHRRTHDPPPCGSRKRREHKQSTEQHARETRETPSFLPSFPFAREIWDEACQLFSSLDERRTKNGEGKENDEVG